MPKVYFYETVTSDIAGNSDGSITVNYPTAYTEILGIIPLYVAVSTTWETYAVVSGVYPSIRAITIHTFGDRTQQYTVYYAVLYR